MQITKVQNIPSYTNFFGAKTPITYNIRPLNCDIFEKSSSTEIEIIKKNIYSKLINKLGGIDKNALNTILKSIVEQTGIDENEVKNILSRLTFFSCYKSLNFIQQELQNRGISSVSNIIKPYQTPPENFPVCLTSVFNYILKKNGKLLPRPEKNTTGIVLDSYLLKFLDSMPDIKRKKFMSKNMANAKFVYFEDFENGYNFLNKNNKLEEKCLQIMNCIKNRNSNPDYILNGENLELIKKLNLKVDIIKPPVKNENDLNNIVENLSEIMPNENEYNQIIDKIFCENIPSGENDIKGKKHILNFAEKMLFPISAGKYNEYLKILQEKIDNFILKNNKDKNNTNYIIPSSDKSFITVNYQNRSISGNNNFKFIFPEYDIWYEKNYNPEKLPDNSTIIVLDDCIVTGLTLAKEAFRYTKFVKQIEKLGKNISVILAATGGTKSGVENLENLIKQNKRTKSDTVLIGCMIPQWDGNFGYFDEKYLDIQVPNPYLTAFTLPYMGPDMNAYILRPLLEKFLFSPKAQKSTNPNLDFI